MKDESGLRGSWFFNRQFAEGVLERVHLVGTEALTDLACEKKRPAEYEADRDRDQTPGGGFGGPLCVGQG